MLRALLLGGVALGAALLSTPTAHAGNICAEVKVTGVVNQASGRHCPWTHPFVQCHQPATGFPSVVWVAVEACVPRVTAP